MTTDASTDAPVDAAREALVAQLRPLCSSLYPEHRAASPAIESLLETWQSQISSLLASQSLVTNPQLVSEIQHTYEQGVAIAFKQREFELAQGLVDQMKALNVPIHDDLYAYRIRAVPLQWLGRPKPLSLEELRALDLGTNWEHALLELVRTEEQPHHRKSSLEKAEFQQNVREGVAQILAEYEADVPKNSHSILPYNAAVRCLAVSGLPFSIMLRVLNEIPKDSNARRTLNTETFVALLEGARWQDIPLTLERLGKSNLRLSGKHEAQDARARSKMASQIWDYAMRAICNSFSERFLTTKRNFIQTRHVKDLQNIFIDVEAQLQRIFPEERFATMEDHTAVYETRIKAAALLGLPRQVHTLLDDYKSLAPVDASATTELSKSVFLKALEIFPSVGLKRIAPSDIERVATHRDVTSAPEIVELKREVKSLVDEIPTKKQNLMDAESAALETKDEAAREKIQVARRELRKTQDTITKLKKRLQDATRERAGEVALQNRLRAADRSMEIILEHLTATTDDGQQIVPLENVDVAAAVMTQYMTAANRYAARMTETKRDRMATEIMRRVDALLDLVTANADLSTDEAKIREIFSLAIKTAAEFWRVDDVVRLLDRKKQLLGSKQLDVQDYDRLVFLRAVALDLGSAYDVLQELHYAGTAPTATTIHRIVTGVLLKLYGTHTKSGSKKKAKASGPVDNEDSDAEEDGETDTADALEDEEAAGQSWSNGPSRLEDVPSFIQEWYNLYRVKPMAKTVVPVFARLLASNNVWEVKRLLQILESMDGGLSPVTEFWLEKRLNAIGKSLDDLRYSSRG